jgi:hypothetical protein
VVVKFDDGVVRGRQKADEVIVAGDSRSAYGSWMDRQQRFDHAGDWYEETVTDPETGRVVHHEAEPLSQHPRPRRDAKRKLS